MRFLLIGDGYGMLGALLKQLYPSAQIVYVDLGRTLLYQAHHVRRAHPDRGHVLMQGKHPWPTEDFVYCPSDRFDDLLGVPVDVAINVASMLEMAPEVVRGYFALLRSVCRPRNLFYCCNRERKVMPGGEVSEFDQYPCLPGDQVLADEPCPWHQFYLSPRGRARRLGVPVPFIQEYDGVHKHRLVVLQTQTQQ